MPPSCRTTRQRSCFLHSPHSAQSKPGICGEFASLSATTALLISDTHQAHAPRHARPRKTVERVERERARQRLQGCICLSLVCSDPRTSTGLTRAFPRQADCNAFRATQSDAAVGRLGRGLVPRACGRCLSRRSHLHIHHRFVSVLARVQHVRYLLLHSQIGVPCHSRPQPLFPCD